MKTYPYSTSDGLIELVEKSVYLKLQSLAKKLLMLGNRYNFIATPHDKGGYLVQIEQHPGIKMHFPNLQPTDLPHLDRRVDPMAAQYRFPHLTADEREFLISGLTPKEWAAINGD